ncbi:MAG: hypothetical protein ACTSWA_10605 [Candidatus Thorarchaeota archaeon]
MHNDQKSNYDIEKFLEPIYCADVESIEFISEPDQNLLRIGLYPIRGFNIQNSPEVLMQTLPITSIEYGQNYSLIQLSHPTEIIIHWSSRIEKLQIRGIHSPQEQLPNQINQIRSFRHGFY